MSPSTDDVRIEAIKPLISPAILMEELPLEEAGSGVINRARSQIAAALRGEDRRLVVLAGPCSIHDVDAALDYAERLKREAERFADELIIVMRVYFEKPRTTVGWKGLINDPHLDNSFKINAGLHKARGLLLQLAEMGMPAGTEFLDTITPQFLADLVSWGAIGARTTESQVHRELASGLSMPVGFKNGTDGTLQIAIDAIQAAREPHHFLSVTKQGLSAIVATKGNPDCHVILRGGAQGPNYHQSDIEHSVDALAAADCLPRLMVDCSHGNSGKKPERQPAVADDIAHQLERGRRDIFGVMLESHIEGGAQKVQPGTALRYGQSITDGCLAWNDTVPVLERLAAAVRATA